MNIYSRTDFAAFIAGSQTLPESIDSKTGGNTKRFGDSSEKYFAIYNFQARDLTGDAISYANDMAVGYVCSFTIKQHSDDMNQTMKSYKYDFRNMKTDKTIIGTLKIRHAMKATENESTSSDDAIDYEHVRVIGVDNVGDEIHITCIANVESPHITEVIEGVVGETHRTVFDAADTLGQPTT